MNKIENFLSEVFGEVRVIKEGETIWFCASDVAKALEYKLATDMTRNLDGNKMKEKIKTNGGEQIAIFINKDGLHEILSSTRKIDLKTKRELYMFLTKGEFNEKVTTSCEEIEFMSILINSLKPLGLQTFKKQHKVSEYKIDLYLPELNIAIEYDENDHKGYTYEQHEGRQKEIEDKLGCRFIRVNDKNDLFYNIGYVIREITDSLNSRSEKFGEELIQYI